MKRIQCREHGGYFQIPSQRGRPPVRCSESNRCDAVRATDKSVKATVSKSLAQSKLSRVEQTASTIKNRKLADPKEYVASGKNAASQNAYPARSSTLVEPAQEVKQKLVRAKQAEIRTTNGSDASLVKAKQAKVELEAKGWIVQGKKAGNQVEITATRDDEIIYAIWENGVLTQPMQYSLWSFERPSLNEQDMPKRQLPFDPEWVTDKELAQYIVGNKITWYNRLGRKEESAVCGHDRVTIEHIYNGTGDEFPAERLIKFTDGPGGVTRVIRLGQLIKVGK